MTKKQNPCEDTFQKVFELWIRMIINSYGRNKR